MSKSALSLERQVLLAHLALERLAPERFAALLPTTLSLLAEALFLGHPETERFLQVDGPRLAKQLRRRTRRVRVVTEGRVRGRIEWAATFQERATGGNGYVCREAQPDYDQLENQCLFYILVRMEQGLAHLEREEGTLSFPLGKIRMVRNLAISLRASLPPTGAVCLPRSLTAEHRAVLRKARGREYRALHILVQRHHNLCVQPDPSLFVAQLRAYCPTPCDLEDFLNG